MPRILLGGPYGRDPIGERALLSAFAKALPDYEVVGGLTSPRRAAGLRRSRRVDGIVVAGETFTRGASRPGRRPGASYAAASNLVNFSRAVRRPLAFLGVSTGSPGSALGRSLARRMVRGADLLLVADDSSARCLAQAGAPVPVRVSADPAWLGLGHVGSGRDGGETVTVVLDDGAGASVESALLSALARVSEGGMRIKLVPWGGDASPDRAMSSRVAATLRSLGCTIETVASPATFDDASRTFEDAGVVVTLRYRAVHAAAAIGVPIVGVGIEDRITAIAGRLEQVSVAPGELAASLPRAVAAAASGPGPSPAAVKDEISRAEAGFSLLRLVLERGDGEISHVDGLPLAPDPWLQ